jgi:hypothetical protein
MLNKPHRNRFAILFYNPMLSLVVNRWSKQEHRKNPHQMPFSACKITLPLVYLLTVVNKNPAVPLYDEVL